ncbi:Wzz/FepE/Etk N-terminal domain-containing protein [Candidatus Pseudothioglobus singularis]|jgi:LPS O-antigen subunit length determinant protein (WzzB/FepE family)|uniref:Polysaccharide chain length determinant N-terminal domain-containing protein n=1 Tax=Candidatus Pseudothioglobus singularis PS1 TaxID=1125411 RepID=A0A0M5KS78_9GAMM|nr:Wzz/FepE/Etk N-terminal domain-containing protein [Candidatus Pseudothioglobus singularis]ALE02778.1 hypothetical protein W908_07225 [Candidatus Pseudothioglobus singularis PS1]
MSSNLSTPQFVENEIDFREIIKALKESKKLIISTILIITTISIFYTISLKPIFKSTTLIEIGYFEMPGGVKEIIETPSILTENLKVDLIYKNLDDYLHDALTIQALENKLIKFEFTSKSSETNKELLNRIINYIYERHNRLSKLIYLKKKNLLTVEIESIKAEISYIKLKLSDLNQSTYLNIIENLKHEAQATSRLNLLNENAGATDKLFNLNQRQSALLNKLEILNSQNIIGSQTIGDIRTITIMPKNKLIISLGFVIGCIFSIFLVFLKNSIHINRELKT